ncbi:MAG: hypothetical protein RBS72_19570 [Sedimentisphaerales bacterium]|jgi:hypothetical protein|nr:hypothetical protein [Sedimentisphaerales bacterium]HNY80552.1 hypothetical protein [Sedimentisphaerales bacterium]HOC65321.1 hypothetical protein [Sedimentisphaerales bacterium]HOH66342.1 hypothetical protein [Sedimentisphaerales bacterium]HPY48774.1 hypothetical protein [Sedimentisphaerales bacterium]
MDRREFLASTLAAGATASVASTAAAQANKTIRIVGVSCSPRKGKTTATAIQVALDAARTVDPRIRVELIDLGGLQIAGSLGGATSAEASQRMTSISKCCPCSKRPVCRTV